MREDNFEEFLKKELSSYPDEKGGADLWEKIEENLARQGKKGRKYYFLWFFLLGFLVVTSGIGIYFIQKPTSADGQLDVIPTEKNVEGITHSNSASHELPFTSESPNQAAASQKLKALLTDVKNSNPTNTPTVDYKENSNSIQTYSLKNEQKSEQNGESLNKTITPFPGSSLKPLKNPKKPERIALDITSHDNKDDNGAAPNKDIAAPLDDSNIFENSTYSNDKQAAKHKNELIDKTLIDPIRQQDILSILALRNVSTVLSMSHNTSALEGEDLWPMNSFQNLQKPNSSSSWAIQAEAGANRLHWKYRSNNANNDNYATFRNKSEASLLGNQVGITLVKLNDNRITWRAGLFYQNHWVKTSFQNITIDTVMKQNVLIKYLVDPRNNEVLDSIFGDAKVAVRRTETFAHHNQFNYIQIPLSIGYEWGIGGQERLFLGVEAGLNLNIWWQRKGIILDDNGERLSLEDDSNRLLNNSGLFISAQLNPILRYRMTAKTSLLLRPFWDMSLSNWMNKDAGLRNRPSNYGINFGLRYDL